MASYARAWLSISLAPYGFLWFSPWRPMVLVLASYALLASFACLLVCLLALIAGFDCFEHTVSGPREGLIYDI